MTFIHARRALLVATASAIFLAAVSAPAQTPDESAKKPNILDRALGLHQDPNGGWVFVGSKKSGATGLYMAISKDGYSWQYVNEGKFLVRPTEQNELMLDPFIQRGPNGTLYMVWTWSKDGKPAGIGFSTSIDILHWTKNRKLNLTAAIPGAASTTSPSVYYDPAKKDWLILWTSTVGDPANPAAPPQDRIYSSTTTNFKTFTPARLFFDPGYSVTDATLLGSGMPGLFYLLFQDERTSPPQKRIYAAEGPSITGPWQRISDPVTEPWSEAPAPIQVPDGLLVYYHSAHNPTAVTSHEPEEYGAAFTKDMTHWIDESLRIRFPGGLTHGSFVHISTDEYNILQHYFLRFDTGLANEK